MSKINRVDLKQLRILQALLRERSASRAGDAVGLTQQAVSDQLRKLRDVFDDPLFVRRSNGLTATPLAEKLQLKVDRILKEIDGLLQPDEFDPARVEGKIVIAATDYAQQAILPELLQEMLLQAPRLKIEVQDFDAAKSRDQMAAGQIDICIGFPDSFPENFPSVPLLRESYSCVAAKDLDLTNKSLTLETVADLPQITVAPDNLVTSWFKEAGFAPNIVVSAPCFSAVPKYLVTTQTIAFLPSRIPLNPGIEHIALDDCPIEFEIVAAWHIRADNDPLLNWLIRLLQSACAD
ncbi:transcriptional regulator [Pseudovibrio japonicus]|uniref:Transcriptional regulator n=1 Tax=Pseudovibrio japonicus TaxID=366534 RepID=A0ABQ3EJI7_9HYPH|nr:transcriptional regulator [Pseudovibrio japonicus]